MSTARCSGPTPRWAPQHDSGRPIEEPSDEAQRELLAKYVDAFERYDIEALTTLIAEDATQSMPPWAMWLRGRDEILDWWQGPGAGCRGSRLIATEANGSVAFGQYKRDPRAGMRRGRCRCSASKATASPSSRSTSTWRGMFPLFGLPVTSAI